VNNPPTDAPGTFAAWTSAPLTQPATIVGAPTLDVRLSAPTAAATQGTGPAGQLVMFAKIYDVAPDGTVLLKNRLVSPVRIADVTRPVRIELPAVAHQIAAGHRIRVVLAASDAAYGGNTAPHTVTVHGGTLLVPVVRPFAL
jgi:predicted acyl esterase